MTDTEKRLAEALRESNAKLREAAHALEAINVRGLAYILHGQARQNEIALAELPSDEEDARWL